MGGLGLSATLAAVVPDGPEERRDKIFLKMG